MVRPTPDLVSDTECVSVTQSGPYPLALVHGTRRKTEPTPQRGLQNVSLALAPSRTDFETNRSSLIEWTG